MTLRDILFSLLGLTATMGMASPAVATDMPKEGVCHFTSTMKGGETRIIIGTLQDGGNGLAVFDETGTVVIGCGQGQSPPSPQHCFGTSEIRKGFIFPTGYCVTTDQDGNEVAWKLIFEGYDKYTYQSNGTQEALIGSGKYEGIAAKGKLSCSFMGGPSSYTHACEGDFNYKLK